MTQITAASVNELRKRTDMPLMDCKKALQEANGDMDKAIEWLRSQNSKMQAKRALNETAEGRVGVYIDPATENAAIIEVRCESAPVTKSEQFIAMVGELARAVAENNPESVDQFLTQSISGFKGTVTDRVNEVIGLIRENMKVQRFQRLSGGQFGHYVHHDGTLGVLLQVKGAKAGQINEEALRDVCAHVAAMSPQYLQVGDLPAEVVTREKDMALRQIQEDPKNAGKPANILEKIVEGKLKTWYAENVLVEQPIANQQKYDKKTVAQVLKGVGVEPVRYVRYKVGEVAV
jgi:elongation factor Ts